MSIRIIILSVVLLLTTTTVIAGIDRNHKIPHQATKASAIDFMETYYDHLTTGMDLKQAVNYFSEEMIQELRLTLDEMTGRRGGISDIVIVQRVLDLWHIDAGCEDRSISKVYLYGTAARYATIVYDVTDRCTPTETGIRKFVLKFQKGSNTWLIRSNTFVRTD